MFDTLIGNWWIVAARAAAALLLGVLVLLMPGLTLGLLVSLFGVYALADGALALLVGARLGGRGGAGGWALAEGAVGVSAGVLTLLWPGISVLVLMLLVAIRAIGTGAFEIVGGVRLHRAGGDWLLAVAGAVAVALGTLLAATPAAWVVALLALTFGAVTGITAVRLRALARGTAGGDGMMATA